MRLIVLCIPLAAMLGCAGLGDKVPRAELPEGAPGTEEILADLGRNDGGIRTFRASGTFTLESPKLEAVQRFRSGHVKFRRPADLYVQGNHRITNMTLFKLTCVGDEFLMEFPTQKEQSFYQLEGEQFVDVPFSVSPSDIAREMFLPEPWLTLSSREARVVGYNPGRQTAVLEIGPRNRPRRLIEAARIDPESPVWVVVRNERLDERGHTLAVTTLSDYRRDPEEGVHFPAKVEAFFPTEETRMTFDMRNIRVNLPLMDAEFDLRARARELGLTARIR